MPLPPGHYQELSVPLRRNSHRERWVIGLGSLLAVALVAVVLISLTSHEPKSGHGCLDFTYAMAMGGERLHECGAQARKLCADPPSFGGERFGGLANGLKDRLGDACREAGLPHAASA